MNDHPDRTSYFQPVLDVLDYRPSALELVPEVILTEGKSDFFYLRYLSDVLQLTPSVHVVPGMGAGSLDTLISLYVGWAKSFVVLLDGDREGRTQKQRYQDAFGGYVADRCFTLRDLGISGLVEIEDIFLPRDRQALLAAVHGAEPPRYSKKALLRAVLELNAQQRHVEISPEATQRARALLEELVNRLPRP